MAQKIWLVKHKGTANLVYNLVAYSRSEEGLGYIRVDAVHAFIKKKLAEEWLKERNITHYEVIGVELPASTHDARRSH